MDRFETGWRGPPAAGLPATIANDPREGARAVPPRVAAPLAAQLIAARLGLPQCRRLRRTSPDAADAAYAETRRLDTRQTPRRSRSV